MLTLAKNWWVPTVRGIAAIIFGVIALGSPHAALVTLVAVFGIYALVDGIFAIAGLFRSDSTHAPWYLQLLVGVTGIMAGLVTLSYPGITAVSLLAFIAAFAIVIGIGQLIAAVQQRHESGAVPLGVSGVVSLLFGALMFARPVAGAVTLAWMIGIYAIIAGIGLCTMGWMLYGLNKRTVEITATPLTAERTEAGTPR